MFAEVELVNEQREWLMAVIVSLMEMRIWVVTPSPLVRLPLAASHTGAAVRVHS
jgi:hypothetical protein